MACSGNCGGHNGIPTRAELIDIALKHASDITQQKYEYERARVHEYNQNIKQSAVNKAHAEGSGHEVHGRNVVVNAELLTFPEFPGSKAVLEEAQIIFDFIHKNG